MWKDKKKAVRPIKREITVNGIKYVYINGVMYVSRPAVKK
jgi:hypothetical protein